MFTQPRRCSTHLNGNLAREPPGEEYKRGGSQVCDPNGETRALMCGAKAATACYQCHIPHSKTRISCSVVYGLEDPLFDRLFIPSPSMGEEGEGGGEKDK
jgi:hypothetical protein